jgi:hypothetical protein
MTTTKIRAAGVACLAALTGFLTAGTLILVAPSSPAEQSGTATADQSSVASGNATAINGSVASGNSFAQNGSVASGCSTAIDNSTASGGPPCPAAVTPTTTPAAPLTPAAPAAAKVAAPTFAG